MIEPLSGLKDGEMAKTFLRKNSAGWPIPVFCVSFLSSLAGGGANPIVSLQFFCFTISALGLSGDNFQNTFRNFIIGLVHCRVWLLTIFLFNIY
jgi:hypothetical protein